MGSSRSYWLIDTRHDENEANARVLLTCKEVQERVANLSNSLRSSRFGDGRTRSPIRTTTYSTWTVLGPIKTALLYCVVSLSLAVVTALDLGTFTRSCVAGYRVS